MQMYFRNLLHPTMELLLFFLSFYFIYFTFTSTFTIIPVH
jgi:hypothetical protein